MTWSERYIAGVLARQFFDRKYLVMIPNCTWPGSECDLLVVKTDLRLIDVEIKISRADLKADALKDKWREPYNYYQNGVWTPKPKDWVAPARHWPDKIWKHYYCMPAEVWRPELAACIPPASGIVLLTAGRSVYNTDVCVQLKRQAKPNRKAEPISVEHAVNIARLASLRMWEAYDAVDAANKEIERARDERDEAREHDA